MRSTKNRKDTRRATRSVKKVPRNKIRPNYSLLFALFAASIVVSCAISYALQTPSLNVKEIKIQGVHLCQEDGVSASAKPALGKNILLLHKSPILARIRRLSEVRDVKMGRVFPDKVWIRISERKACAMLTNGRDFCLVQFDGLVFHKAEGPVKGLPLVTLARECSFEIGRKAGLADVRYALDVIKFAHERRIRVDKISVDQAGDICLNMESDFYVKLGQPDDIARKMKLLRSALDYRPSIAREARYIDLSCPSAPVWKPKMTAQAAL